MIVKSVVQWTANVQADGGFHWTIFQGCHGTKQKQQSFSLAGSLAATADKLTEVCGVDGDEFLTDFIVAINGGMQWEIDIHTVWNLCKWDIFVDVPMTNPDASKVLGTMRHFNFKPVSIWTIHTVQAVVFHYWRHKTFIVWESV